MEQKSDKSLLKKFKTKQTNKNAGGGKGATAKRPVSKNAGGKVAPVSPSRARLERHANDEKIIRNIKIAFTSIVVVAVIAVSISVFLFFYKPAVATVAGAGISQSEFTYNLMAASSNVTEYSSATMVAQSAINNAADMKMQAVLAKENGYSLTKEDKENIKSQMDYIDQVAEYSDASSSGGKQTGDEYMQQNFGVNKSQFKKIYESQLLINHLLQDKYDQVEASDEDAQAQYDADVPNYREATVRHILFFYTNDDEENPRLQEDSFKLAEDTLARINAGEDMAALVQELSEDSDLTNEGIYSLRPTDGFEPGFIDWTFSSERQPGDTGICETSYGYHVMRLEDMRTIPFEEVKDEIISKIKTDGVTSIIEGWKNEPRFTLQINQKIYDSIVMQILGSL